MHTKELIMVKLALGAPPPSTSQDLLESTIKASLIPSVDSLKTIGLVHLPGMMTGMIIAGVSPIQAVKYQIIIMFSLMTAAVLSSLTICCRMNRHFSSCIIEIFEFHSIFLQ
jgi:putative ABC transport system permease protein